jgi:hypothetical protein
MSIGIKINPPYCLICRCYRREGLWAGRSARQANKRSTRLPQVRSRCPRRPLLEVHVSAPIQSARHSARQCLTTFANGCAYFFASGSCEIRAKYSQGPVSK